MNKLSKIFLCIIIILTVALITMTFLFLKMKETAFYNFSMYKNTEELVKYLESQLEEN